MKKFYLFTQSTVTNFKSAIAYPRIFAAFFLIFSFTFNQQSFGQCTNPPGNQWPGTILDISSGNGNLVQIASDNVEGDWSQITGIVSGATYTIYIGNPGDYITVHVGAYNSAITFQGPAPFTFTATSNSDIFIHYTCDASCDLSCSGPARLTQIAAAPAITSFPVSGCPGSSITLTGTDMAGVTLVTFNGSGATAVPTAASPTSVDVTIPAGTTTGTITATGPGGSFTTAGNITMNGSPAVPGAITGTTTLCDNTTGNAYSVAAVSGATGYTWTYSGTGATINGTGANITIDFAAGATGGTLSVTADNTCGSSAPSSSAITINPNTPVTPGAITGTTPQCPSLTGQTYSITAVANATTYTWTMPVGWTITGGAGTNSITVTTGAAGQNGNITVTAGNSCGTSAASSNAVTVNPGTPATPGAITGTTPQCPSLAGQTYSITSVTNATTYTWTVPLGWTITSGAGTTSITVTAGAAGQNGNITVTAGNSCGTSTASSLPVTVNPGTPAAPTANAGSSAQCTQITVNWSASANATTYYLDVSTVNNFASFVAGYNNLNVGNVLTTSVTGLTAGTTYYYRVRAGNSCGTSGNSLTITYATSPATPATPNANAGSGAQCTQITANWSASANATTYYLDVSTVNNFASFVAGYNNLNVGNVLTTSVTGLTAGTTYYYRVRAGNSCGTSGNSLTITYATSPATPATPNANAGNGAQCTQITANWSASANATTYYLDVSTVNNFASFVAGYNNLNVGNVLTTSVTGLTAGTTYYYRVRAGNSCGTSGNSLTITYATSPATPATPTANAGSGAQCTQITANWSASVNATTYYLDVSTVNNFASFVAGYNNLNVGNVLTTNVTGLTPGTTYYYRVRAGNSCGTSGNSLSITYATSPATPATPGAITGTTPQCPSLTGQTYSITSVTNATTYTWTVPLGWTITSGAGTTSITVTAGAAGQNGNITVTAGNSCGTSTASSLPVTVNPGTPAAPTANAGSGAQCTQITANWSASANATTYYLDVSTVNNFASFVAGYNNLNVGNVLTTNVTGLTAGTTYYYRVRAGNSCGTGGNSLTITYATSPATPATPNANAGSGAQCTQITANWSASTNATTYYLDVSTVNNFASFVAGYNNLNVGNVLTTNITGLTAGTTYYYRVRAGNSCGTSGNSLAITYATSPAAPATPNANAGSGAQCTQITANWSASANATTYYLDVSTVSNFASFVAGYNNLNVGNVLTTNVTGLTAGTTYYYRVRAGNSCGTSGNSLTITYATSPATPATPGAITGTTPQCPSLTGQTYSITAVANATTYTWTVPVGWTITAGAGTTSITITTGAAGQNGNITVTAGNSCGTSTASSLPVTVNPGTPATPNANAGSGAQCTQITANWTASANATTYYLDVSTVNNFASFVAGYNNLNVGNVLTTNITGLTAGTTYYYRVRAGNSCGTGGNSLTITYATSPATPATPNANAGSGAQCTQITANWTASANATTYYLDVSTVNNFASFVAGYNNLNVGNVLTTNITGLTAGTTYYYRVRAGNSCATSGNSLTITYATSPATPATPGAITGTTPQCPSLTGQTYSITAVANATTYTWTVPVGWTITAGAGTTSITVTTGAAGQNGNITVTAGNSCGTGTASSLPVTVNPGTPAQPGTITGPATVCPATSQTYSITAVANATTYTWTVPAGWTITGGQGTTTLTITSGAAGQNGNISVTASNSCGTGSASQTINITPANGTNNTGYTDNNGPKNSGTIDASTTLAGWVKFPLTGIPAGSTILSSSLSLTNNGSTTLSNATNNINQLTVDPVTAAAATLYTGINSGPAYSSTTWSNVGTINLPLNATANTDIQNGISTGYIAMGLDRGGSATYIFNGYAGANPPVLSVTYSTPGGNLGVTVSPGTPASPATNSANGIGCTQFTARWVASTNATTYYLDVSTVNTFASFVTGYNNLNVGNITSATVTGLTPGAAYYYRVRAGNSCGTSPGNATITAVTSPLPAAPGAISGGATQCASLAGQPYSITAVANATSYAWTVPAGWTITGGAGTNSITVTTGASGQNGNITVTPTNSCGTSGPATLAVIVNPKPAAGAITGANTVCIGANIILTSNASGNGPFTFTWSSSNTSTATIANTGVVLGQAVGTTNITYTVTDGNGCSQTSANYTVTVTKPTANAITQASGITTICVNSTVLLTSNATGINPLTYTWTSSDNTKATVSSTGLVTGVAAGTVNITYTVTDGNGCSTTSPNYAITVNAIPTGSFTATESSGVAPNDNIICSGASVTFTAPAGYNSYTFYVNGTKVLGPTTVNTYNSSTLLDGSSVTVDVANSLNCGTTFGPIIITVKPLPTPTLTATKTVICAGDPVTFTAGGGTNYVFKVNNSPVLANTTGIYSTSTLANGDKVTVDVTDGNSCVATSAQIIITVNPPPTGTLSASPSNTICQGDNVTFTASGGYPNYEFKLNSTTVQGPSSTASYSNNALNNGDVVSVIATTASGCSAPFTGISMNVNTLPTGSITTTENSGTANDNKICAGATVTFTATAGFSNYKFYLNGGGTALQNSGSNFYASTTLNDGDYITAVVTNGNGCIATFTSATITVIASPAGTLTVSPSSTICAGDNVTFRATSDPSFTGYTFKINNVTKQVGPGNTFNPTGLANNDVVTVEVTNSNSCVSTFAPVTMTVNALPTGTLVPVENSGNAANDGIICTGATIVFTAPSGFSNYDFLKNGATIQSGNSNTYTTNTLSTGDQFTVAVKNASGCIGLLNTITVTVNPLPVVDAITGPTNVCKGSMITLLETTAGGVWSSQNTAIATISPATGDLTGVAPGTATIVYTVTNSDGCTASSNTTITVNAPPPVSAITGNVNMCTNSSAQFTDATPNGTWGSSNSAIASVDASGLVTTGNIAGSAVISYTTAPDANGCTNTATINVTVNASPALAPITPSTVAVCVNSTVPLTDATSGGGWSSSDDAIASVNASGVVTGHQGGTVTIYYTITPSCGSPIQEQATVNVNALPAITTVSGGGTFCGNTTITADNGLDGTMYFQGTTSGGSSTAAPSTSQVISTSGTYYFRAQSSSGCWGAQGSVTVTINPAPAVTTVSGSGTFCGNTVITASGGAGGTIYFQGNTSGGTSTAMGGSPQTVTASGTYYFRSQSAAGCWGAEGSVTVNINAVPAATIVSGGGSFCASTTITASGGAGGTIYFQGTTSGGTSTALGGSPQTITTSGTYYFRAQSAAGCWGPQGSVTATITAPPTANAGANQSTCSNSGTVPITGAGAKNQSSVNWTTSGTGTFTNGTTLTPSYTPGAADIAAGSVTLTLTANGNGTCAAVTSTKILTIYGATGITFAYASPSTICLGDNTNLVAGPATTSSLLSEDFEGASGSFTVVNGTPFTDQVRSQWTKRNSGYNYNNGTGTNVTFNSGSNNFMLTNSDDPAGGNNYVYTSLVSPATSTVGYSSLNLSYRTYYRRIGSDVAVVEVSTNNGASWTTVQNLTAGGVTIGTPTGFVTQNINLNSYVNNAAFQVRFRFVTNNQWYWGVDDIKLTGTASSTFNFSWTAVPAATAGLPPGAGTPSPGNANIVATPTAVGNTVYTATLTNGSGCSSTKDVTVTVNPIPTVSVTADYCAVPNKVKLTATASPGTTLLWSTGETTTSINVDVAGVFEVTASLATGCSATASIQVAQELVTNGDFETGGLSPSTPIGFTSDYAFKQDLPGLVPAGQGELYNDNGNNGYSITPSGQNVHINFWGHDHTTGTGNFMAVNGHGNTLVIWKQTVNVLPNTTYYFSAWAMSLNSAGNNAQLQFSVNGTLTGTTAVLANHGENSASPDNWIRFYGTWTSGPTTTTADIYINDLQSALSGNDFGLDDISFGTLSTFIQLESAPGTDAQTICVNTPITNIVYSVGSTASAPTITGLPAGLTTSFNGIFFTISGTPTGPLGTYAYTVKTSTTCPQPSSATGTITIQGQAITLTSGSSSPTVCTNSPVNIRYTLSGTATNSTASGLPAGVNLSVTGNTVTVSGTPTIAGSYPFTITTSGTCTPVTTSGTIIVQEPTVTLNSGNKGQTVCINAPIANIQFTVGGTATNASVTGLPSGVTGMYNAGLFIIKGTPTASGTFNYTVTTSGGSCGAATATGTLTVTPAASLTLTSGPGTNPQSGCKGVAIIDITYAVNNATGASVSGLPTGLTSSYNAGVFTITGTASAGGTFNYTITTSGGCGIGTATGTITVREQTVVLTSGAASPSVCTNTPLSAIVYTFGGAATSATVTGLPTNVSYVVSGNTVTISGTPTDPSGTFNYTVTTSGTSCAAATATGTITVQAAPVGGSIASVSICSGTSGSLTLTGNSNPPVRWEYSTDGTTWTSIANTTITQNYTNITVPTFYRAVVSNGCGTTTSSIALVGIHNYWTGATSTDWNTASNWSDGQIPSISCPDVYVPLPANGRLPVISGTVPDIINLNILSDATVTINATGTLTMRGSINEVDPGSIIALNGTFNLDGSTPQTIPASAFRNNALNSLIISNTNASGVTLAGALDIYQSVTYSAGGTTLATGGFLTLKSTQAQTAWLGNMNGHTINGDVTVERYIATGTNHAKSWQFLATPATGTQTVNGAWMEGATTSNTCNCITGNPKPGFGTMVTGTGSGLFDATTADPSIKTYNTATNDYTGISGTNISIYNKKGYFVFVRGDRSVYTAFAPANQTVLRTKGTLFTPANPAPSTAVAANLFESVGNPYASAIDMRNFILTGGVEKTFIVWDPTLGGAYGYGAFQTITQIGSNYYAVPGQGSRYPGFPTPNNYIQSGQAFLIQGFPASGGTISFNESVKAGGSALITAPNSLPLTPAMLRTSLFGAASGSATILDGVLNIYGDNYSNAIDGWDARKMLNSGVNLGIRSGGKLLAIERRSTITQRDTILLNLTGVTAQNYRFHFEAENLGSDVEAFLEDSYLNVRTPISLTASTDVDFSVVNIAGSYAANRFRIVFAPLKALPVTFTSLKAYKQDKNINVEWRVDNEINMKQYEVEKSTDGNTFATITVKRPAVNNGGSAVYVIADADPVAGYNYYRIRSVDINDKTSYTNVVKVLIGDLKQNITIYPNPITDGMIHLQLVNQPQGKYLLRLINKIGQVVVQKQVTHAGGNSTQLLKWNYNLAHGIYQLEVTKPDGSIKDLNVLY